MTARPAAPPTARVLVTRSPGSWPALVERFRGSSIVVEFAGTTVQVEPRDPRPGDDALAALDRVDWLVLTSGQGVKALILKLAARGRHELPAGVRVAVVGPATARACAGSGIPVDLVASEAHSEGLAGGLRSRLAPGARVLVVRPEGATGLLAPALRALGAHVVEAPLYRTVASERAVPLADEAIAGGYAAFVFTAPSALDLWLEAAGDRRAALHAALAARVRVAIGPTTATRLAEAGLAAHAVADTPDERAIGDAIARALRAPTC